MGDSRKTYWNDKYVEYWQARVGEAGIGASTVLQGDVRTEDDGVYEKIFSVVPFIDGTLLDVGCAWGRMFPIYLSHGVQVVGIDISQVMIDLAKEKWKNVSLINELHESSAEKMPFEDGEFDNLVCLATFDATYQHEAITEFLRVTKEGAHIYVTGKNTNYPLDDDIAMAAEIGARKKGHPNFFTQTSELVKQLESQGHKLLKGYYFSRRGDFSLMNFDSDMPEQFYEYLIVFTRGEGYHKLEPFSDIYSETYQEIEKNNG